MHIDLHHAHWGAGPGGSGGLSHFHCLYDEFTRPRRHGTRMMAQLQLHETCRNYDE